VPFRNLLSAILPYEMGRLSSRAYVLIRLCAAEVQDHGVHRRGGARKMLILPSSSHRIPQ
jgi:hypothetical protein